MSITATIDTHTHPDTAIPFGGQPGSSFQPQHILYYKLKVIAEGKPTVQDWEYQYTLYGLFNGINITQFIELLRADDLPPLLPTSDDPLEPASVTITKQCYVVLELRSDIESMRFRHGTPVLKTVEDHQSQYRRLSYVDDQWAIHTANPTSNCNIVYYAVKSVALEDENHQYNIYVEYDVQSGPGAKTHTVPVTLAVIDPAIRNRGDDDDNRIAIALRKLRDAKAQRRVKQRPERKRDRIKSAPQQANDATGKPAA